VTMGWGLKQGIV